MYQNSFLDTAGGHRFADAVVRLANRQTLQKTRRLRGASIEEELAKEYKDGWLVKTICQLDITLAQFLVVFEKTE